MIARFKGGADGWLAIATLLLAGCGADVHATRDIGPAEVDHPDQWYPMNQPSALGQDHSGNGRDALAIALDAVTDPTRGTVASFDGSALVFLPQMKQDFTIGFWLKSQQLGPDSDFWSDGPRIINADISGVRLDFSLSLLFDKAALGCGTPGDSTTDAMGLKSTRTVVDGTWHHLAISRNGQQGVWRLFVDGELDASRSGATGGLLLPDSISFGVFGKTDPPTPALTAELSDARLYSRLLSAEAVAFLAQP